MSAVRLVPDSIETVRFLCKDSAKTLSVCMSSRLLRKTTQRYEIFFKQHSNWGVLHLNISLFAHIFILCLDILTLHLVKPIFRAGIEIFDSCWEHSIFHIPEYVPLAFLQFCQFYFQPFPLSDTFSESPVVLSDFSCRNEILCACPLPVPMRAGIYKGMISTWFGCLQV